MRISSRAVIIENNKLLTMFRRRKIDDKYVEYFTIPGGGQDDGESLQETVKRELKEEMNVDISIIGYLGSAVDAKGEANYFHCKIVSGTPVLSGEELERLSDANFYKPTFLDLKDIENVTLYGKEFVYKAINKDYLK